jgi:hypothetical protein
LIRRWKRKLNLKPVAVSQPVRRRIHVAADC